MKISQRFVSLYYPIIQYPVYEKEPFSYRHCWYGYAAPAVYVVCIFYFCLNGFRHRKIKLTGSYKHSTGKWSWCHCRGIFFIIRNQ